MSVAVTCGHVTQISEKGMKVRVQRHTLLLCDYFASIPVHVIYFGLCG